MSHVLEYTERYGLNGKMIAVVFQKVFDSVNGHFNFCTGPWLLSIKLELFADDLTAFLRNDESLRAFLEVVMKFGNCTGLAINFDKTEILILGNSVVVPIQDRSTGNIEIKEAVKILGVYFTYNHSLTGLEIISRLVPVKLSGQTYFCSDTTHFWPDKSPLRHISTKSPPPPLQHDVYISNKYIF